MRGKDNQIRAEKVSRADASRKIADGYRIGIIGAHFFR
jgi:hypothetical protein